MDEEEKNKRIQYRCSSEYLRKVVEAIHVDEDLECEFPDTHQRDLVTIVQALEEAKVGQLIKSNPTLVQQFPDTKYFTMTSLCRKYLNGIKLLLDGDCDSKLIRYIKGPSGIGKSFLVSICTQYLIGRGMFVLRLRDAAAIVKKYDQKEGYDNNNFSAYILRLMAIQNSPTTLERYLGDELAKTVASYKNTKDDKDGLINFAKVQEQLRVVQENDGMHVACIVDDFNAIVNETEKEVGKISILNMLPYVLPEENALEGEKLILLVAASQHHCFKEIKPFTKNVGEIVNEHPPSQPMDLFGMKRCLSANFTYKGSLDKVFNLINEAILESGCVARLAIQAMKSVAVGPMMTGGINLHGKDYLKKVRPVIQDEVKFTIREKIKAQQQKVKNVSEKLSKDEFIKQYQETLWMVIKSRIVTRNNIETRGHFIDTGILTTRSNKHVLHFISDAARWVYLEELGSLVNYPLVIRRTDRRLFENTIISRIVSRGVDLSKAVVYKYGKVQESRDHGNIPKVDFTLEMGSDCSIVDPTRLFGRFFQECRENINSMKVMGLVQENDGLPTFDLILIQNAAKNKIHMYAIQITSAQSTSLSERTKKFAKDGTTVLKKILNLYDKDITVTALNARSTSSYIIESEIFEEIKCEIVLISYGTVRRVKREITKFPDMIVIEGKDNICNTFNLSLEDDE